MCFQTFGGVQLAGGILPWQSDKQHEGEVKFKLYFSVITHMWDMRKMHNAMLFFCVLHRVQRIIIMYVIYIVFMCLNGRAAEGHGTARRSANEEKSNVLVMMHRFMVGS